MTGSVAVSAIFVPYGQGRARGLDQDELGNHGVDVDRLVALGLPVVPGLTVPDFARRVAGPGRGGPRRGRSPATAGWSPHRRPDPPGI